MKRRRLRIFCGFLVVCIAPRLALAEPAEPAMPDPAATKPVRQIQAAPGHRREGFVIPSQSADRVVDPVRVVFDPTGVAEPATLTLSRDGRVSRIAIDGAGEVTVDG